MVIYNEELHEMIINAIQDNPENHCLNHNKEHLFDSLVKHTSKPDIVHADFLNQTYGELRAPQYLKDEEVEFFNDKKKEIGIYYGRQREGLSELHPLEEGEYLMWAISHEGALLIGEEIGDRGHPSITGFKSARIAGELHKKCNGWFINSKSGRYSKDYNTPEKYLENALVKFQEVFTDSVGSIECNFSRPKIWPYLVVCTYR